MSHLHRSGRSTSDVLRDKPHEGENNFWSVDLMIDELVNLLKKLGIAGDFDALGHSWGGMLLAEFIIRGRPQAAGLKRLILSSSLPSLALWHEVTMKLLATFPKEVQEGFEGGFNDIERLRPAAQAFFERYGCRARPFPEGLQRSINAGLDNPGPHLGM
jgi:pimeloyl-ACP methyl ester carboxylesterase